MLKWYIFLLFNICTYGDNFTTTSESYTDMIHIPEYYGFGSGSTSTSGSGSTSGFDPGSTSTPGFDPGSGSTSGFDPGSTSTPGFDPGSGSTSGFDPGSGSNKSIVIHHNKSNKETDLRSKVIYGVSILLFSVSIFFILYGLYVTPKPTKTDETIEVHTFTNPLFNFDDLDENDDEPLYQPNVGIPKYAMYNDNFDYDFSDTEI